MNTASLLTGRAGGCVGAWINREDPLIGIGQPGTELIVTSFGTKVLRTVLQRLFQRVGLADAYQGILAVDPSADASARATRQ